MQDEVRLAASLLVDDMEGVQPVRRDEEIKGLVWATPMEVLSTGPFEVSVRLVPE